ncbi:MAG: hypothetical protein RJB38_424 [Pseudomonadota bacterium]
MPKKRSRSHPGPPGPNTHASSTPDSAETGSIHHFARHWLSGVGAVLTALIFAIFCTYLIDTPLPGCPTEFFRPHLIGDCKPEPREQVGYFVFVCLLAPSFFLIRKWFEQRRFFMTSEHLPRVTIFSQYALLILFLVFSLAHQQWLSYFPHRLGLLVGYFLAAFFTPLSAFAIGLWHRLEHLTEKLPIHGILCVAISAMTVSHAWMTDETLAIAHGTTQYHMEFVRNEFAAVASGKSILVDIFPLYSRILPYLAQPYFNYFGLTWNTYTLLMALMNATALLCCARIIRLIFKKPLHATVIFLCFSGLAVWRDPAFYKFSTITYHAIGPIRILLPAITLWLLIEHFHSGHRVWRYLCWIAASLGVINNPDFGLPAFAAATLTTLSLNKRRLPITIEAAISFIVILLIFVGGTWLRSGSLPELSRAFEFQKIFAKHGYFMLPMGVGLHFAIIGIFVAGLFLGISRLEAEEKSRNPALTALTLASSIFALGATTYFMGRSHPRVTPALFWPLGLVLVPLVAIAKDYRSSLPRRARSLLRIPLLLLGAFLVAGLQNFPNPSDFLEAMRQAQNGNQAPSPELLSDLSILKQAIPSNSTVVFIQPAGPWLSLYGGFNNIAPQVHEGNILLKKQLLETVQMARIGKAQWFAFKEPYQDLRDLLFSEGFRPAILLHSGQLWHHD